MSSDETEVTTSPNWNGLIPTNLEELRAAAARENPINIAGYGRESTHKGYLSWILSEKRNRIAVELLRSLSISELGKKLLSSASNPDCTFEKSIGNHKVDLQVKVQQERKDVPRCLLPIELKTDSGPSGDNQFKDLSTEIYYEKNKDNYIGGLVFCLGSSSVYPQDRWAEFEPFGPKEIWECWSKFIRSGAPSFFDHWMESVSVELGRRNLAHEVYKVWRDGKRDQVLSDFGFRSPKHLLMYVYDHFRAYLQKSGSAREWQIYDGGYNAVMNLCKGPESFFDVNGIGGVTWFFEFNDNQFCLKIDVRCEDRETERASAWANSCVARLETNQFGEARPVKGKTWKNGWRKLISWQMDFSDFPTIEAKMNEIIRTYGASGMMGREKCN